jgi:cytosine/adenosine deaminase-related metal-dependent hydrolase
MMETSKTNFVKQYEPGTQARVELKNGRILDVVNGRYFDAGTSVILRGGVIESMPGHPGEPADVKPDFTIDLQGKTVLPSLFNTHMHGPESAPMVFPGRRDKSLTKKYEEEQILKNMIECLAHGVTNLRNAGFVADMRVNRIRMEKYAKDGIPAPRFQQAVVVGPTGSYMQEKVPLPIKVLGMPQVDTSKDYAAAVAFPINASERQVRDAVDIAIDERGADVIKIGDESFSLLVQKNIPMMTIEQLSVLVDQARLRGVQSTMHHMSVESFRRGVKAGVSSLAHVPFDDRLTQADVETFKASGCLIDPTISASYNFFSWKLAGNHSNGHPELDRLTEFRDSTYTFAAIADEYWIPELREAVLNGYKRTASGKPKAMGFMDLSGFYAWNAKTVNAYKNFLLLYENCVPMTTGNDTVSPCTPAMMDLELLMFDHVLKGKPEGKQFNGAEAVKIATINSARSLGLEDEFGSIESGKRADLVILDGDPLADFHLIGSRVKALFMDGELVIDNCGLEVESNGKT